MTDATDPRARKRALRRQVRARIAAMAPDARRAEEAALGRRLDALPGFDRAATVLLYASAFAEEPDTSPWIARAIAAGRRVVLPRFEPGGRLALLAIGDPAADLVPGALGIPEPGPGCAAVEPGAIDWALIPGLAFDRQGGRLGRGGGCYDRLLPMLRPGVPTWALIFRAQWVDAVPLESHDRRVGGVADADLI